MKSGTDKETDISIYINTQKKPYGRTFTARIQNTMESQSVAVNAEKG